MEKDTAKESYNKIFLLQICTKTPLSTKNGRWMVITTESIKVQRIVFTDHKQRHPGL